MRFDGQKTRYLTILPGLHSVTDTFSGPSSNVSLLVPLKILRLNNELIEIYAVWPFLGHIECLKCRLLEMMIPASVCCAGRLCRNG